MTRISFQRSEMEIMADQVVVIAKGRLLADESIGDFVNRSTSNDVLIRSPRIEELAKALVAEVPGLQPQLEPPDGLAVTGLTTDQIGEIAFRHQVPLAELTKRTASLEQAFLELTESGQEFQIGGMA